MDPNQSPNSSKQTHIMKSTNFLIIFLFFILFNTFHCDLADESFDSRPPELTKQVNVLKRELREFETDLLYKKHVQDELDRKQREKTGSANQTSANLNVTLDERIDANQTTQLNETSRNQTDQLNEPLEPHGNSTDNEQTIKLDTVSSNQTSSISSTSSTNSTNSTVNDVRIEAKETDLDDYGNSTLDDEERAKHESLFEIEDDQFLIDGYQTVDDKDRLFLIEEFVKKLDKERNLKADVRLVCLPDNCDEQKILLITVERLVLKYELIRQNIFLDKSSKFYDYLDCFHIQYNPNFGLRSYLRNDFTFDFKKAFINTCLEQSGLIYGSIYLTNEFNVYLTQQNITHNVLIIKFDYDRQEYELKLEKEDKWPTSKDQKVINNLKYIYEEYDDQANETAPLNDSCTDGYVETFDKVLNGKRNPSQDKVNYLNQLNSSLFRNGLHQKLNKFKYLKAQIIFDSGLLKVAEKENFKILNRLFQIVYESQNQFKQLNMYLVVVRLRFKMPNDLNIFSNTDLRMNVTELYDKLRTSNDDTYFDLSAEFKILFTSFKFYHEASSRLLPSYSSESLISSPNSVVIIDFSYLQTNHWLLTYEIGHLLGIKDDSKSCKCLSEHCIMQRSSKSNVPTWSLCSIKQLESNLKVNNFDLDLAAERTEFKSDFFNHSICGNGVLERNELCDCGKFGCFFFNEQNQTYQQNRCCNSTTCQLTESSYQCALGSCCDLFTCSLHGSTRVCRSSQDICDIEENCDGTNAFCPEDDYYVNGESCGLNRYEYNFF